MQLSEIAERFNGAKPLVSITPLGNGLINETYLVRGAEGCFVLQQINTGVFKNPDLIMFNLERLQQHLQFKAPALQVPQTIKTSQGQLLFCIEDKQYWRALQFIEGSESREIILQQQEAEQIGYALAHFHCLFSDLDPNELQDTLPGFHHTPTYYKAYQAALIDNAKKETSASIRFCKQYIEQMRGRLAVLEKAKQQGVLRERVIHGDPKMNNFLFSKQSDQVLAIIDLDTVKPGLVHYDIGDCLRSCCHDKDLNHFDLDICEVILSHYLDEARHFFCGSDYDYLSASIELISFELGLRFFTDYLTGDRYFKIEHPEHNLERAINQFELCKDIAAKRPKIDQLIKELKKTSVK